MSKWIVVATVLPALIAGGCSETKTTETGGAPTPAGHMAPRAGDSDPATQRAAAIYASVIRRFVTRDHPFGGADPGFQVVYVLDGPVVRAGDPMAPIGATRPATPFDSAEQDAIRRALADLPPIEFVSRRASVIVGANGGKAPGSVKGRGVLLTLGPIRGGEGKVRVAASLWLSGLAGRWLTYVVQQRGERWTVTGTTGPITIS
jgi:hypothetical protein